jgi:hypothetical protein
VSTRSLDGPVSSNARCHHDGIFVLPVRHRSCSQVEDWWSLSWRAHRRRTRIPWSTTWNICPAAISKPLGY